MIFNNKPISEQAYKESSANFIGHNENTTGEYSAHFDGGNSIAVGYGLDLLVNSNVQINNYFIKANIPALTSSQTTRLDNMRKQRDSLSADDFRATCKKLNIQVSQPQASELLAVMLTPYEQQLSDRLEQSPFNITEAQLPKCDMRIALLDMVFNGGSGLIGNNLRTALSDAIKSPNDSAQYRAAAWVEIRYFSNGDRGRNVQRGIQNRRNRTADLFGLTGPDANLNILNQVNDYLISRYQDILKRDTTELGYQSDFNQCLSALTEKITALKASTATVDNYDESNSSRSSSNSSQDIYTIQSGDTLTKIANRLNMTLSQLLTLNPSIDNPDIISVGQEINIRKT